MTICHYTNSLSAHQLPLDYELVKLVGAENFRYIYTEEYLQGGAQEVRVDESWIIKEDNSTVHLYPTPTPTAEWLENCDLLIVGGIRPIDLMERRLAANKATFYMAERWFKPILFYLGHFEIRVPGWVRLFHLRYFKMAKCFVKMFNRDAFRYLSIGIWSKYDILRLCRFFGVKNASNKIVDWGYFVAPSGECEKVEVKSAEFVRVLWVGRMLKLKHVETIIRAIAYANSQLTTLNHQHSTYTLTLVGDGPEKPYLISLTRGMSNVFFSPSVSLDKVREVMRAHDVIVFASNGYDGWGAVVSEALVEGMCVIGTHESGAPSTLLPPDHLFHCGDVKGLADCLEKWSSLSPNTIGKWTAEGGAQRMMALYDEMRMRGVK